MDNLTSTQLTTLARERAAAARETRRRGLLQEIWKHRFLYLLGLPGLLFMFLFSYGPMPGIIIAFQDFYVTRGFFRSPWVGFAHFQRLFTSQDFWLILRNSIVISLLNIVFLFPAPIILALMLNEVRSQLYKRFLQTIYYLPHFLSWVIVASLTYFLLSTEVGVVNKLILARGGTKIPFLMEKRWFYPIILTQTWWKGVGWGTIIYLAAIAGLDPALYEAAQIDGAGRLAQTWYITIPGIMPTVRVLFILSLGNLLSTNFEQLWLMGNTMIRDVSEVIDTYVYRIGVLEGQFSYTTAVGMFKSVVGLILILTANWAANKFGEEGIW